MKRLRSYDEDLGSIGERGVCKDWGRRDQDSDRSHRRFYSKAENGRKGVSSSSGYDRSIDDDREVSRSFRKQLDHDSDGFERRKSFDRYRDRGDRGMSLSSPRNPYSGERIHRSESFSGSRREFPKGFRSERDRSRREESVSSWRRFGGSKDVDEDTRFNVDTGRGSRVASAERGNVRSPQGSRDVLKSPPCSKDSGGEQSRSTDVKKNEEVHRESGSSSEMEEGELQPEAEGTPAPEGDPKPKQNPNPEHEEPEAEAEPKPESEPNRNAEAPGVCTENCKELENAHAVKSEMDLEKGGKSSAEEKIELKGEDDCDGKREEETQEPVTETVKEIDEVPECLENSNNDTSKEATVADNVGREGENAREDCESVGPCGHMPEDHGRDIATKAEDAEKPLPLEEEREEGKGIDLEAEVKDINFLNSNKEVAKENGAPKVTLNLITDKPTQNFKDKGKSLAVSSYNEANSMDDGLLMEADVVARRDDAMEGPSCRGFELFSSPPATRQEKTNNSGANKQKDEMLKMEPLELSLGLPNVSLELHSHDPKPASGSPSRQRSVQSVPSTFWTGSDGFTASISFSGSQQFVHNPSCSLTQNSFDNYEQSIGSHPIFQGVDQISHGSWQGQLSNESKRKEVPLYPRILLNGTASQSSQGILNHKTMQVEDHHRISEGTSGVPVALDCQSSRPRQLTGVPSRNQDEIKSPAHSVGSLEARPEYRKDKKREKRGGSLFRSSSQKEIEQLVVGGTGFVERIIAMIILEPLQVMAKRIHEMTEQSIACLKESACEMIVNEDKHGQLRTYQEALQSRSDLTLETLSKCNRAQLEILVAFKTGLQDFLYRAKDSPLPDLAEIFLNSKCRNLACRSPLPVDECDCKVCVQKSGFCSACMCLVCSKFDMASNTCSWVGCDFCLHWCHTSCGLREYYIRNGHSVTGAQGTTEMQFHCLACNHPSEMFGFVKEVFKTCAREWKAETLSKELQYVKRIFSASNDVRGKQLHDAAEKMRARLEHDKSNLSEVYNQIMEFLTETDSRFGNISTSGKEQPHRNLELSTGVFGPSQEAMWLASVSAEKTTPQLENASSGVPSLDWDRVGCLNDDSQLQKSAEKKPVIDELESVVRIKQAEAKMFQVRADDARRDAEGLKRIAIAKNEKIEEEYRSRITKLRLVESEERRRQKLEELESLERAHREYFNMKMRIEAEIRDLLLKMETAQRNLTT
ncbi:protein OBERON 4-like isoform X2 [Macadamia integrifolia]|uniref:protein OBERON 4-like isoform X2 n=1 Tax=Macadamia integrifolia TaxID=60698 RepID=UPI001C4F33FA|nr:protein OBERON 4-like isoform X2 [Macadamia integrifolia]